MTRHSILGAGVAVTLGSLVTQAANLGRDVAFAVSFGSNLSVDCFLLATMIPIFLITVATGAYRATIVPVLERAAQAQGQDVKRSVVTRSVLANLIVVLAAAALLALAAPWYSGFLAGRLPDPAPRLIAMFTWATLPMLMLTCYANLADGPLQTQGRFFPPSAARAGMPVGMAAGALAWGDRYGLLAPAIGGLIGAACQSIVIFALLRKEQLLGMRQAAPMPVNMPSIPAQFALLSASISIQYVSPIIDQWMASLLGPGSVSALTYANRLAVGAGSLMAGAIGPVLLPVFSRLIANAESAALTRHYVSAVRVAFWIGLLMTAVLWIGSEPLIALLYEHGRFSRGDTELVAGVLACLALQFPALLPGIVAATLISASGSNRFFLPLTLSTALTNAAGNLILMRWYGLAGIAVSTAITYVLSLAAMSAHLHRRRLVELPRRMLFEGGIGIAATAVIATLLSVLDLKPARVPSLGELTAGAIGIAVLGVVATYFLRPTLASLGFRARAPDQCAE